LKNNTTLKWKAALADEQGQRKSWLAVAVWDGRAGSAHIFNPPPDSNVYVHIPPSEEGFFHTKAWWTMNTPMGSLQLQQTGRFLVVLFEDMGISQGCSLIVEVDGQEIVFKPVPAEQVLCLF
jgi:hypothetical protein